MSKPYTPPKNIELAVKECTPSINKLVYKWTRNHYQDRADLIQCAYEGVMLAWKKYDSSASNKFSTYAHFYILWKVRDYAMKNWNNKNNECEYKIEFQDMQTNDMKHIETERELAKVDSKFRAVFEAREAGFTFNEIAEEFGFKNLHKARHYYLENVQQLKDVL